MFVSFSWRSAIIALALFAGTPVLSAEAEESNILLLDSEAFCASASGDTLSAATCMEQQIAKAERWRAVVVDSYRRMAEADLAELSHGGKPPYDTLALLSLTESTFERYREEATKLVQGTGLTGSGNKIFALQAEYYLTIDHIRFLLDECHAPKLQQLGPTIDLTKMDWCALGGSN